MNTTDEKITITPAEAAEIMRKCGISCSAPTVRAGLEQRVFPFGVAVETDSSYVYMIFRNRFTRWIDEMTGSSQTRVDAPETTNASD